MSADSYPSPQEIAMFQALVKPGIVYLLMMRLDRPIGAREVSDLLGIHEQTAAKYLRTLSRLNLVARIGAKQGYVLLDGSQLVPGELPESLALPEPHEDSVSENPGELQDTMKISQYPPTTIKLINNHLNDSEVVVVDSSTSKISHSELLPEYDEIWRELAAAGIGPNDRTRELVRLPHITPDYVKAHRLQLEAIGKDFPRWAGLLVTVLERGDPAAELNPNGHLGSCMCVDCHRYKIVKSWADP